MVVTTLTIADESGSTVAKIQVHATPCGIEHATYTARVEIDRGAVIGLHQRYIGTYPRGFADKMTILKAVLETFDYDELRGEGVIEGEARSSDLEWGLDRPVREIQAGQGPLRHNGPSVRGGQSVQHGDDPTGQGQRDEDSQR